MKGQPLLRWVTDNILASDSSWFEENKASDAYSCLEKITRGEPVSVPLYKAALQQAISIRSRVEDIATLAFCYELQSTIVNAVCGELFAETMWKAENKEAMKERLALLKDVRTDLEQSQERSDKFAEELNNMYETYFWKPQQNQKDKPAKMQPNILLPLEFSSYFFKSLSTLLLQSFKPLKWAAVTIEDRKKPLVDMCVEHQRLFTISSMLMLAIFYLRLRIKLVKPQADIRSDKFALIPLSGSEYYAVYIFSHNHRLSALPVVLTRNS